MRMPDGPGWGSMSDMVQDGPVCGGVLDHPNPGGGPREDDGCEERELYRDTVYTPVIYKL